MSAQPDSPRPVTDPLDPLAPSVRVTKLRVKVLSVPHPQYQIAALAGIHPTTLSHYIHGKKDIQPPHLIALCKLFDCESEEIMGWVDSSAFYGPLVPAGLRDKTPGERYTDNG